jgi:hypothetical protein
MSPFIRAQSHPTIYARNEITLAMPTNPNFILSWDPHFASLTNCSSNVDIPLTFIRILVKGLFCLFKEHINLLKSYPFYKFFSFKCPLRQDRSGTLQQDHIKNFSN